MHLRFPLRSLLLAVPSIALAAGLAGAAPADLPIPEEGPGDPTTDAQCLIGELRAGNFATTNLLEPGTVFYQLLTPSQCPQCTDGRALETAVWRLRFGAGCDLTVSVRIVATMGAPGCYQPNPQVDLCMPTVHVLSETQSQTQAKSYVMPLHNGGCCIESPAFLRIEVLGMTCAGNQIALPYATPCTNCTQYITSPSHLPPGVHNQCASGFSRNYRMWCEVDCCSTVGHEAHSWGRLKTLYR